MEHDQNKFIVTKGRRFQGNMKDYATTHMFALALEHISVYSKLFCLLVLSLIELTCYIELGGSRESLVIKHRDA